MNSDRTTETIVEAWLADGFAATPDVETMLDGVRVGVAATAQRRHRWWTVGRTAATPVPDSGPTPARGFTMFSALKFMVASVIVALFGGLVLAGLFTAQQGDETGPSAVTESPSTMTSEELLSGMVTEEVEPGVVRVVNDGVRDIAVPRGMWGSAGLSVQPNGDIWVHGETVAHRLGQLPEPGRPLGGSVVDVTSDGTLWVTTPRSTIASFDGEAWTERATLDATAWVVGIATTPDGTAWATTVDSSQCPGNTSTPSCRQALLVRMDATGTSAGHGWDETEAGRLSVHKPMVSPDGNLWLVDDGDATTETCSVDAFHRYDGTAWRVIDVPEGLSIAGPGESFGFGPDGTLWAATGRSRSDGGCLDANHGLARLDESGWSVFTESEGVRPWGGQGAYGMSDHLQVAPDGGVWVAGAGWDGCHGVARFDGASWMPYLEGYCVDGLDITPEGTVWALAAADSGSPLGLYVIDPEAMETNG
jgi:hypothetical protein